MRSSIATNGLLDVLFNDICFQTEKRTSKEN